MGARIGDQDAGDYDAMFGGAAGQVRSTKWDFPLCRTPQWERGNILPVPEHRRDQQLNSECLAGPRQNWQDILIFVCVFCCCQMGS